MKELHSPMDQTIPAKGDSIAQPLASAQILCGANGYNPDGAKFTACWKRLSNSALANRKFLPKPILWRASLKQWHPGSDTISEKGQPTPCYDFSSAQLIIYEDI